MGVTENTRVENAGYLKLWGENGGLENLRPDCHGGNARLEIVAIKLQKRKT